MVHFHVLFMRVFTVGQSRRISEANNRELQAQYFQIQQVSGNPRRGRSLQIRQKQVVGKLYFPIEYRVLILDQHAV